MHNPTEKAKENPPSESPVALALGITLASTVSLGIYLAYHFGHGNSLNYWTVLLGTALASFLLSLTIFILRRYNAEKS